jgi:hypothetical protein
MTRHNVYRWETIYEAHGLPVGNLLQPLGPVQQVSSPQSPANGFRVRVDNMVGPGALDAVELRYRRDPAGAYAADPHTPVTPTGEAFVFGGQFPEDWIEVLAQSAAGCTVDLYIDRAEASVPI